MGMGDGEGVGGGIDTGVQRHLRGWSQVAIDHLAFEVDHRDHLSGHGGEVGARGCHGHQVTFARRDVAGRTDHESPLGQMTAGRGHSFSFIRKQ
jgi:hypothetical protein